MIWKILASDENETRQIGFELAKFLLAGDTIGLVGTLGAGKTTITQGIAKGLGVDEKTYVNSPTFTILNEYETNPPIAHFDFYRLDDPEELYEIGYDEFIDQKHISLIEWFEMIPEAWPENYLKIEILEIQISENKIGREMIFTEIGEKWQARLANWSRIEKA